MEIARFNSWALSLDIIIERSTKNISISVQVLNPLFCLFLGVIVKDRSCMISFISRLFLKGSFTRSVGILTLGTASAQGLAIVALPLLTRLYTPEQFETLAVYVAVLSVITTVSCLRFNIAIPIPKSDIDGMALLILSLGGATLVTFLLVLVTALAPDWLVRVLGQPGLRPYLWMIPSGVFFGSVYTALQFWATRKKQFALVSRTRIVRAVGGVGTQASVGLASPASFGLLFGHLIYSSLGVVGLARQLWRADRKTIRAQNLDSVFRQARVFRRYPIWSVGESFFNTGGGQLPLIMIAAMISGPEAGFAFLAMRVMGMPMALIGSSISQVFLTEAPAKLRDGTLAAFTNKTVWALAKIGALPMLAAGLASPVIFGPIFGDEWERAGWIVAWMTPWFLLQFLSSPVSMVIHIVGKQALAMNLQVIGFAIRVGATFIAIQFAQSHTVEIFAASSAIFYLLYIAVISSVIKSSQNDH